MTQPTPLRIVRVFEAPVGRVFRAWSDPQELRQWAWGSLGKDVTAEVDLRVGGTYRIETSGPDQVPWAFTGTYEQIDADRRLAYTVEWTAPMGYESPGERVTVDFVDRGGQTEVVFVHEGVPDGIASETHDQGWNNTFNALERHLRSGA